MHEYSFVIFIVINLTGSFEENYIFETLSTPIKEYGTAF